MGKRVRKRVVVDRDREGLGREGEGLDQRGKRGVREKGVVVDRDREGLDLRDKRGVRDREWIGIGRDWIGEDLIVGVREE